MHTFEMMGNDLCCYSTTIKDWNYYDICNKKVLNDTSIFSVFTGNLPISYMVQN